MAIFEGKATLVTGAGSGIGRAIAQAFAAEGSRVMIADVDAKGGEETVKLIEAAGGTAAFQKADVSDQASVEAMVKAVVDRFGRIDHAVNNAAIDPEVTPESDWDIDVLDRILSINLRGVALCLKAEIAAMQAAGGGCIVNLASMAGVVGVPNKPFYCAAKHGVVGITRSAALAQAKNGIRINAIAPGFIETPMALANLEPGGMTVDFIAGRNPTRRIGRPEEIGAAAVYLCSPYAGFTVGQTLSVDGGVSVS
ncbi:SDR family NAD(P)-dependent oxidoreductase [Sphingomonas montanisoli]|uniref:Glucose 1-dehydrogenase n=1 Tax=Sphingomonas montanisoli TaxID=2606412 RepID=A0A5D9C762_9SPHN|nr:glucose 1-dehydrogenase [Sphingomonas montanisoli]TZG27519.1 glucose 1-dehydrogenase [Sphingomonas montanisoli]